jgi:hypothetical protein
MQSSADVLKADQPTTERVSVLLPFGLAERQARRQEPSRNWPDTRTTQRYMHLSPALDAAIRLLETGTETSRVAVEK